MSRFLALLSLVGVLSFGLVAVGCGGDDGDGGTENQTAATEADEAALRGKVAKLRQYTRETNAAGFCGLFEPNRLEDWIGRAECIKIFRPGLKNTPDSAEYRITDLKVEGDQAEVTFDYGTARFERIDGEWYIETPEIKPAAADPEQ